jgi:hypothetical protein
MDMSEQQQIPEASTKPRPAKESQYKLISLSGGGYRAALFCAGVLRAFHFAQVFHYDSRTSNIVVNSVSGSALPTVLWKRYLSSKLARNPQDAWPEKALLDLVCSSPALGGRFNWMIRGFGLHARQRWEAFLRTWWEGLSLEHFSLGETLYPLFLVECLDFFSGELWVFNGKEFTRPSREFFKTGMEFGSFPVHAMTAVAAATAFPGMFRGYRLNVGSWSYLFKDAGLIDNLGVLPLLTILKKKRIDKTRLGNVASWFLADAGKPMGVPELSRPLTFRPTTRIKRLGILDRLFRLSGDLAQPYLVSALTDVLEDYANVPSVAVWLDLIYELEQPWMQPKCPRTWAPGLIPTALRRMNRQNAVGLMALGAQSASFAIAECGVFPNADRPSLNRTKLKDFFAALL